MRSSPTTANELNAIAYRGMGCACMSKQEADQRIVRNAYMLSQVPSNGFGGMGVTPTTNSANWGAFWQNFAQEGLKITGNILTSVYTPPSYQRSTNAQGQTSETVRQLGPSGTEALRDVGLATANNLPAIGAGIDRYMPWIFGGIGLIAVVSLLKK